MTQITPSVDSLPKQFVAAMRTLFDIMDDKRTGHVKLTDIENRWRDDRTRGLPKGVIESLQTFASSSGLLTFDRFCAGLNLCLLRNQDENENRKEDMRPAAAEGPLYQPSDSRPPSASLLDVAPPPPPPAPRGPPAPPRAGTLPHLPPPPPPHTPHITARPIRLVGDAPANENHAYGPPKPPRADKIHQQDETEILLHYQKGSDAYLNRERESGVKNETHSLFSDEEPVTAARTGRGPADGKPAAPAAPVDPPAVPVAHKARRREPRRHTLQNGIDYNVLKRMKQIEQEKDILVQGLAAIEKAREWYLKELSEVQEKMRSLSRMGTHVEPWSEAQQERVELRRARVLELNRRLAALAGARGLDLHMNLALSPSLTAHTLQRHNQILTQEVTKKSERISVLEREKSALIRELLALTNRNKTIDNMF